jgi:hypothetical protein
VIVFGVVIPLTPNAAPETVIIEIVKSAVPAFVNVTAEVLDVPVVTFPKLTLAGLMLSCGFATKVVAVIGTVAVDVAPAALLKLSVSVPVTVPPELLLNHTVAVATCPAASVNGKVTPVMENCETDGVTCVSVMLDCPVFVTDSVSDVFCPTVTPLNVKLNGASCAEIAGGVVTGPTALTTPEHPLRIASGASKSSSAPNRIISRKLAFCCLLIEFKRPKCIYVPSPDLCRV